MASKKKIYRLRATIKGDVVEERTITGLLPAKEKYTSMCYAARKFLGYVSKFEVVDGKEIPLDSQWKREVTP